MCNLNINNIEDITSDILDIVIYNLDKPSLIILSSVSKLFNTLCNQNHIWKKIYLKTLHSKYKISDDSVHIHCATFNPILYLYEIKDKTQFTDRKIAWFDRMLKNSYPNNEFPCTELKLNNNKIEFYSTHSPNTSILNPFLNCRIFDKLAIHNNNNIKFIKKIGNKPLIQIYPCAEKILKCGCLNYQKYDPIFTQESLTQLNVIKKYLMESGKYNTTYTVNFKLNLYKTWKRYNIKHNLCQFCQDPLHYDINTLESPKICRYYKSYKNILYFKPKYRYIQKKKIFMILKSNIMSKINKYF